jgi:hypothetical protein
MPRLFAIALMEISSVRGPLPDGVLMMSWIFCERILSSRSVPPSETRFTTSAWMPFPSRNAAVPDVEIRENPRLCSW